MGLLTELFVATDAEAKAYDHNSADRFRSAKLGGLTNLEFETLWAILAGEEWSPKIHALGDIASSNSTWTFKFPRAYIDRLRAVDAQGICDAAKWWAVTEELSCEPADLEPVIEQLVSLARSLDESNESLFVWTSL